MTIIINMSYLNWYFVVSVVCFIYSIQCLEFVSKDWLNSKLQVTVTSGTIQGLQQMTVNRNVPYYMFQGIPYAAPPVGPLRWKSPQPHAAWKGVLNTTFERSVCTQMATDIGTEDCLFINAYTPQNISKINTAKLVPVMVWIYGGRFANGYSNFSIYGPDYLLEHGVAFVSFNYRLGIFGFVSTEDLVLPGNYGLKDQIAALNWIQRNVIKFGGDPKNVTIFGDSSGAACVSYLLIIPQAKGLFHKAISESGSALCPWAFQREPKRVFNKLAFAVGVFEPNTTSMIEKMQREDGKKLRSRLIAINFSIAMEPLNGLPFAPCIEPEHDEAVLTNKSNELFQMGKFHKVPYMIGFTSQEASIVQDVIEITRPYVAHWDLMPQLLVPQNLNISSKANRKEVAAQIRKFYFGNKFISMSTKTEMMNYIGDSQFVRSIRQNVKLCSNYVNIYFYMFSYEGFIGRFGTKKEMIRKVKGAGHVEDLFYLFRKQNLTTSNDTDMAITSVMTLMWTNFAKFGDPTPVTEKNQVTYWPPINAKDPTLRYLDIDRSMSIKMNPREEAMDFWDDIYKEYGNRKYDTY